MDKRAGSGDVFMPEMEPAPARVAGAPPTSPTTNIEALLTLQAVDDALMARRKAARRSAQILDTLEEVKADLLAGRISEGRLNLLLALIGQAREQSTPGLDATLDAVELRARVELAKFGRYTAA
jgi:hypothetical protein